jgi:hypothetical protein
MDARVPSIVGRSVTLLTYNQRLAHWNWCREFIDREAFDF